MAEFTLPLGMFQVHMPTTVMEALEPLRSALRELAQLVRASPMTDLSNRSSEEVDAWWAQWTDITDKVKAAGDELQLRLKSMEFPEVLPPMTRELIYASLVAGAFGLQFAITDYEMSTDAQRQSAGWWVTGRVIDLNGEVQESPGTSFSFDPNNEKHSEGALLSACADAFIHCVFAAVPHFPWSRWNVGAQRTAT